MHVASVPSERDRPAEKRFPPLLHGHYETARVPHLELSKAYCSTPYFVVTDAVARAIFTGEGSFSCKASRSLHSITWHRPE